MSPDAISIAGLVAVLLPTLYFLISSPTFLLAKFEDPIVTKLFRDLLSFHFKLVGIGSILGVSALGFAGRPVFAVGLAVVGTLALAARRWFVQRMENEMEARDTGDAQAVHRLRELHWRGMAYNATQFIALVAIIPFAFASPV